LGVKKSGCSGFAYTMDIAQEVHGNDTVIEAFGAKVLVDAESLPFLEGTELAVCKGGIGTCIQVQQSQCQESMRLRRELCSLGINHEYGITKSG